jgi:hypothetical protein
MENGVAGAEEETWESRELEKLTLVRQLGAGSRPRSPGMMMDALPWWWSRVLWSRPSPRRPPAARNQRPRAPQADPCARLFGTRILTWPGGQG